MLSRCCTHFWHPWPIQPRSKPSGMDQGCHTDSGGLLTAHSSTHPQLPAGCLTSSADIPPCFCAQQPSDCHKSRTSPPGGGCCTLPSGSACRRKGAVSKPGAVVLPVQGGEGGCHSLHFNAAALPAGCPTAATVGRKQAPFGGALSVVFFFLRTPINP